jgi:hypothetical protein
MILIALSAISPDVIGWWLEILPGLIFLGFILIAWMIFWLLKQ